MWQAVHTRIIKVTDNIGENRPEPIDYLNGDNKYKTKSPDG